MDSSQDTTQNEAQKPTVDPDEVSAFALHVWTYKQGELVSLMIHLGDKLGLYRTLQESGPVTASELAERTGFAERWLLEWLRGQAAAKLLDYHEEEDRFELSAVAAPVLANEEESLAFAAGAFGAPISPEIAERLADAFRTGIGLTYEELGASAAHRTERMLGPWVRLALVPKIIPALEGVADKLDKGARVVDVGCGAGVAILAMAKAYPNSHFHGYDPSSHAVARAQEKVEADGLSNVEIFCARGEDLPSEPTYDFVVTLDCVHDMTRPDLVLRAIRRAIHSDGTWLIKDIRSHHEFSKNFRNPLLALLYGFSISACMSSALSEPDGLGLGTLGFNPTVARRMTNDAGFSRFVQHDFEDPANLYYEVRP